MNIAFHYDPESTFLRGEFGSSPSASSVGNYLIGKPHRQLRTVSASRQFEKVAETLIVAYDQCMARNWGGNDEAPLKPSAIVEAARFLYLLPPHMQDFDAFGEPDGTLAVEWRSGKHRSLVMSFLGDGRIAYSYLSSPIMASNGSFLWQGTIPMSVGRIIREIVEG